MLYVLFIGLIAGAIAGLIVRGEGFGCLLNIIVGIAGAWIGHWLLPKLFHLLRRNRYRLF